ncbi:MAG: hypothetical protein OSJ24_01400 [Muribaculaceae bacterium]|nr:hypothetical protein [Muribaculaceae bacterium]
MNKKYLFPILIALGAMLGVGCKPIYSEQTFAEYTDCVVYALDGYTNKDVITDYGRINIIGDASTGYYRLELRDFRLTPDGNVCWADVRGLTQYLKETTNEQGEVTALNYVCFNKEGDTYADGDMSVENLRLGWLSTVYWGKFTSDNGRYRIWMLPREVETYANRNEIVNSEGQTILENSLHPRYSFDLNVYNSTATIRANGVVFPVDTSGGSDHKRIDIRELVLDVLPVTFDDKGFSINVDKVDGVYSDGTRGSYEITDFRCSFAADYDGERTASFNLREVATDTKINVTITLDYYRNN